MVIKWKNRGTIDYGEYCGNQNIYLLQCVVCKDIKIFEGIIKSEDLETKK